MNVRTLLLVLVPFSLISASGYVSYRKLYAGPVGERESRLASYRSGVALAEKLLSDRRELAQARDELSATLLGERPDEVEHELRTRLVELGSRVGLGDVTVTSGSPRGVTSPVLRARASRDLSRALRGGPDFAVIEARMMGEGTTEQALRLLAEVEAQPWVHRVRGVALEPEANDRGRVRVSLDVSTMLFPQARNVDASGVPLAEASAGALTSAVVLAGSGMFERPAAPVEPEPPVVEKPAPPEPAGPPAYTKWRVAGFVEGSMQEAWLVHVDRGERRVVRVGDEVEGATLVGGSGETVAFMIGDERVETRIGQTLPDVGARSER